MFELLGNMVDDKVLDSRKATVHWVPSLDEGQGCVADLWVGEVLRGDGNLQPQKPHGCHGGTWRWHMGLLCRHFPECPDTQEGWEVVGCS